jgi:hypothetical protein
MRRVPSSVGFSESDKLATVTWPRYSTSFRRPQGKYLVSFVQVVTIFSMMTYLMYAVAANVSSLPPIVSPEMLNSICRCIRVLCNHYGVLQEGRKSANIQAGSGFI